MDELEKMNIQELNARAELLFQYTMKNIVERESASYQEKRKELGSIWTVLYKKNMEKLQFEKEINNPKPETDEAKNQSIQSIYGNLDRISAERVKQTEPAARQRFLSNRNDD